MKAAHSTVRKACTVAAASILALLITAPLTVANDPPLSPDPVMSLDIEAFGWKFTPAVQCGVIKGFVAEILPELACPGNLDVLLFEASANGTWIAWSWNGAGTATNAIGWIRSHVVDDTVFSENPRIQSHAPVEPATWTAPTRLTRGLLESHPLQLVLGDEPRTSELFDTLEQAGWGVAPIISRLSEGDHSPNADVSLQQLLVALVGKTLELMPGTIAQTGTAPTAGGPIFPWDCSCITSYGVPKLGPWLPSSPPSLPATGGTLCWWERTYKTRWRSSGDYSLSCWNCTGTGTIDSWPPMYTSTNVLLGEPCVAPP